MAEVFIIQNVSTNLIELKQFGALIDAGNTLELGNYDNAVLSDELLGYLSSGDIIRLIDGVPADPGKELSFANPLFPNLVLESSLGFGIIYDSSGAVFTVNSSEFVPVSQFDASINQIVVTSNEEFLYESSLGPQFFFQDGSLFVIDVSGGTADVTKAYVDGSLGARDISINWLRNNIYTKAYIDGSLNVKTNKTYVDGSLGARDISINWLKDNTYTKPYIDGSLNTKTSKTYVDGSLGARDISINWIRNNTYTKIYIDGSLNSLKSYNSIQDSSIALKADLTYVDASLNNKADLDYVNQTFLKESSLGPQFYFQDGSLFVIDVSGSTPDVNRAYVDGSLASRDISINYLSNYDSIQDSSIELKADQTYVDAYNAIQDSSIALKADKTYVDAYNAIQDASISLKSDQIYVDGSLNTKVDQTLFDSSILALTNYDFIQDISIGLKSDLTYVDASLSLRLAEASLGPQFYWRPDNLLYVDSSTTTTSQKFAAGNTTIQSLTNTFADYIGWDTAIVEDGSYTWDDAAGVLTFNVSGWFEIDLAFSSNSNSGTRETVYVQMVEDVSSAGYAPIPYSQGYGYARNTTDGDDTIPVVLLRYYNPGDSIKIQARRDTQACSAVGASLRVVKSEIATNTFIYENGVGKAYVDASLLDRDASLQVLFDQNDEQDSSITALFIENDGQNTSIQNIINKNLDQDASIVLLRSKNTAQDASIVRIDTSINSIILKNNQQDSSIVRIDGSINTLFNNKVNRAGDTMTGGLRINAGGLRVTGDVSILGDVSLGGSLKLKNKIHFESYAGSTANNDLWVDASGHLNFRHIIDPLEASSYNLTDRLLRTANDWQFIQESSTLDFGDRILIEDGQDGFKKKWITASAFQQSVTGGFGLYQAFASSLATASTTSGTYVNELTLVTDASAVAGTYRIGWALQLSNSNNSKRSTYRVQVDGTTILEENEVFFNAGGVFWSFPGFAYLPLTAGSHTITIDYLAVSNTASIKNARLEFYSAELD